jgi:hypothetical protein
MLKKGTILNPVPFFFCVFSGLCRPDSRFSMSCTVLQKIVFIAPAQM